MALRHLFRFESRESGVAKTTAVVAGNETVYVDGMWYYLFHDPGQSGHFPAFASGRFWVDFYLTRIWKRKS